MGGGACAEQAPRPRAASMRAAGFFPQYVRDPLARVPRDRISYADLPAPSAAGPLRLPQSLDAAGNTVTVTPHQDPLPVCHLQRQAISTAGPAPPEKPGQGEYDAERLDRGLNPRHAQN